MILNLRALVVMLASVVGLFLSGEAHAQSCTTFMQDKLTWMSNPQNYLAIHGSSFNATHSGGWPLTSHIAGSLVEYSPGFSYYDPFLGRTITFPATMGGTGLVQLFSDRYAAGYQRFDKNQPDQLGISFNANGRIVITLQSWGNGTVTVETASCANNMISGFSSDGTLWSFAFNKLVAPG